MTAARRILMVFGSAGGVAENVRQLALGLGEHGYHVDVAGPRASAIYGPLARAGTHIERLPFKAGFASPAADAAALARLLRLLRRGRYELVHAHSGKAGALGRIAARRAGVTCVYSPHSFPFVGEWPALRRRAAESVERLLGRLPAKIVCVCEQERQTAVRHRIAPAERLEVVYNGCDPCSDGGGTDARLLALRNRGPVAAAVLGLRRQKSVEVLLEAAPLVFERLPGAGIAVVGNGPLDGELRARARSLGLERDERFAFLAFTAPMERYLRAIDVYVLPSAWEALPIGVLQAQACGVPQVATDVGGTGEAVVADTGILVPPRDPEALAAAICELLADRERRARLSLNSRARHAEHFGVERMLARTARVYDAALAS